MHNNPSHALSEWAAGAADRYRLLLFVFSGAAGRAIDISGRRAGVRPSLARDLEKTVGTHLEGESAILLSRAVEIAGVALARANEDLGLPKSEAKMPDALRALVTESAAGLSRELALQARRDAAAAADHARRQAMAINMMAVSRNISIMSAAIQIQRADSKIDFGARDRAGRSWSAENFVRTVVRHHLLTIYNDSYLWVLAEHGQSTAKVLAETPAHRYDGVVFSIAPVAEPALSYEAIRRHVFHPNSNCLCSAV